MFIENRKLTVLTAALTAIGFVSATSVLLAFPVPLTSSFEQGAATPTSSVAETRQRASSERPPNAAATKPAPGADGQPRDVEKDLIRLAELQAEADLLEITLDGQKASILHSIQFLSGRVSRYAVQDRAAPNDWQQSLQKVNEQLSIDRENYRKNKIKLALLNYQIARESKALGVTLDVIAPLTELNLRLDRLGEKIDRLGATLTGKAGP